jgi:capsular exopolysaccharide synthesis family protein
VIARRKLVAILTAALVLAGGVLFLVSQPRVYESSASVALEPAAQRPDTLAAYDAIVTRLLPLYATKVRTQTFLDRVAAQLPEHPNGRTLKGKVFAEPDPAAAVLKLVARANDPQRAARRAEVTTQQFLFELQGTRIVSFEVIDQPRVPDAPVSPRPWLVLASSLLLAAFLAVAVAVAWERLFGHIHDLEELRLASGALVLGAVPKERLLRRPASALFIGDPTMAVVEESLRNIRVALLGPGRGTPTFQKVTLTSINPEEGKSTLTANLAVAIAEVGLHVLVVDADTHRPRQHEIFDLPNEQGLSTAVDVETALQTTSFPKVSVLTAGPRPQRQSEIVGQYVHVVPKLNEFADFVIVDSAPLSAAADVRLLAAMTDGVVLLVRAGATSAEQLRHALHGLDAVGVPVLGLILTMSSRRVGRYSPYRYAYAERASGRD